MQPALKHPGAGVQTKSTVSTFNSRAMHYPDGSTASELASTVRNNHLAALSLHESKKPTQKQKKRFAELLNLEKLN